MPSRLKQRSTDFERGQLLGLLNGQERQEKLADFLGVERLAGRRKRSADAQIGGRPGDQQ